MEKEQLREGLKRLEAYIKKLDLGSIFLEENSTVPMDTLIIPLKAGEDLSIDISCNYVELPENGTILQFYGQIVLNEALREASVHISNGDILNLINGLNRVIPVGQFLYLFDEADEKADKVIGIRYTALTGLDDEAELKKCARILMLLMQVYELLGSSLLLLFDGTSVGETLRILTQA